MRIQLIKVLLPEQAPKMVKEVTIYIILAIIMLIPFIIRIIKISRTIDNIDYEEEIETLEALIKEGCKMITPESCEYCGEDRGDIQVFCSYCGVNFEEAEKCVEV